MTEQTALMTRNKLTIDEMGRVAKAMAQSGYFDDARDISKAMVKVLAGQEMGLGPFAAMSGIHVIKGKPVLGANLIATLIKNDPRYDYKIAELTGKVARIEFYEHGQMVGVSEFTIEEAKAAGVGSTSPPGKNGTMLSMYPKNMLFSRAVSNGAKWFTPGIFGGAPVYTPDEMGADVDEDGNIVEGELVQETEPQPAPPPPDNGNKPFYAAMHKKIGYFNSWKHVESTMNLLSIDYPQSKDEAAGIQIVLESYADLRANGLGQDEAVERMVVTADPDPLFPDEPGNGSQPILITDSGADIDGAYGDNS